MKIALPLTLPGVVLSLLLCACSPWSAQALRPQNGSSATVTPGVAITSPASGAILQGTISITANASDNLGITGVQFALDGAALGSAVTVPPYTVRWNTTTVSNGPHTVTAVVSDPAGKTASQSVNVSISNNPSVGSKTILPVEVVGPDGTVRAVTVAIASPGSGTRLWMQIHNLKYQTEASVQINGGPWIPINDTSVTVLGLAASYGGIGGGFSTLNLTLPVPDGTLVPGANIVVFRFNGTDGIVSGFRVLNFNFVAPDGTPLVSSDSFVKDDPSVWQPPSTSASDISAGEKLWRNASLTTPGVGPIRATCGACHTQDGRDLKYFNYSNNSIRARSIFHGLSAVQGDQIASYIRSLNVPSPGRPWNPPYQPGPGLDSQPVEQWSAGAGITAVLKSDQDLLNEIFPNGIQPSVFSASGNLNVRETAIPMQLPDWNSWLPTVHPMDAWGDPFLNSKYYQDYLSIRSGLKYGDPVSYVNSASIFNVWISDYEFFIAPRAPNPGATPDPNYWTPTFISQVYSTGLWNMVKSWEINQEFGLEGLARSVFLNQQADSRAWLSQFPFFASPNMLHIPRGFPGLKNGKISTFFYLAFIWYHAQLILNNSNKELEGTSPIDWGYVYGILEDLSYNASPGQTGMQYLWQIKGLQVSNNGKTPAIDSHGVPGWEWQVNDPSIQVRQEPKAAIAWRDTPAATRTAMYNGNVRAFLDVVEQFTPQEFYSGGAADSAIAPVPGAQFGTFGDRVWYAIPLLRYYGVDQSLIDEFASWAKTIWPLGNWNLTRTATCWQGNNQIVCSTQQ
jgi:hypothetical protein